LLINTILWLMKKTFLTAVLCGFTFVAQSQDIEQFTYGIQAWISGVWAHTEAKIAGNTVLRTEVGLDGLQYKERTSDRIQYLYAPVFRLEPRFYFNFGDSLKRSGKIRGNRSSFIALATSYHPDWFTISRSTENVVYSSISMVPTFGIRRDIGNHFTFETGIGVGYNYTIKRALDFRRSDRGIIFNLHLRLGFTF